MYIELLRVLHIGKPVDKELYDKWKEENMAREKTWKEEHMGSDEQNIKFTPFVGLQGGGGTSGGGSER